MFSINRNEANGMYANKDLFAVDESVQREALKNFYEQRAGVRIKNFTFKQMYRYIYNTCLQVEKKKLKNAMWISYWGVPTLVIVFVVTYWILGIENYLNPSVQMVGGKEELNKEEEEAGSSLWMILGLVGVLVVLFVALLWWFYPTISARLQGKKKKNQLGSQQTLVRSKIAL